MSRWQAGGQLPEAPGVRCELGLQNRRLPDTAAVPTQLNAIDPPGSGEGDAAELDRSCRHRCTIRGTIDARHRLDDGSLGTCVVFSVARLVRRREPDPRHPLGLLHAVVAGKEEAGWKAMLGGQRRSIEMGRKEVVRSQLAQRKAF